MTELVPTHTAAESGISLRPSAALYKGMSIACCCVALALLTPVALAQLKIIRKLPELPGRLFDSRRIIFSKHAYPLGIPDGVLGLLSYITTLALLIAWQPSRPLVHGLLRGKLLLDGTVAARKSRGQLRQFGRLCSWCVGASAATAGMIYFARKARQAQHAEQI